MCMHKHECVCVNRQNGQHGDKGYMGVTAFVIAKVKTGAGLLIP